MYGGSESELFTTTILGALDSANIGINKLNPYAALGLAPALMEFGEGGPVYEFSKRSMSILSDPIGNAVEAARMTREILWSAGKADEAAFNVVDKIQNLTKTLISSGHAFGGESSRIIIESRSATEFSDNIKSANLLKINTINSIIRSNDGYISNIEEMKDNLSWFDFGKDTRMSTYDSLISTLRLENKRLTALKDDLGSSFSINKSAEIYGKAWVVFNNLKPNK